MVTSYRQPHTPPAQIKIGAGPFELVLRRSDGEPLELSDPQHGQAVAELERAMRSLGLAFKNGHTISQPQALSRSGSPYGVERDGANAEVALKWPRHEGQTVKADDFTP